MQSPFPDERRREVFESLQKQIGMNATAIARAPDSKLLPLAQRGGMRPEGLHGVEEQLGQGTGRGAHGWNLTTKVTGEPGTVSPTARRAIAFTTTLSGTDGPRSRTCTNANPDAPVVTVGAAETTRTVRADVPTARATSDHWSRTSTAI